MVIEESSGGFFYIVWGILLWCSLPDSDSLEPDSDSLENDFPLGGLLYIMGDFHITWGILHNMGD